MEYISDLGVENVKKMLSIQAGVVRQKIQIKTASLRIIFSQRKYAATIYWAYRFILWDFSYQNLYFFCVSYVRVFGYVIRLRMQFFLRRLPRLVRSHFSFERFDFTRKSIEFTHEDKDE